MVKTCCRCGIKAKSITNQGRFFDCGNFSQDHPDRERDAVCFYTFSSKDEPYRMGHVVNAKGDKKKFRYNDGNLFDV